MRVVLRGPSRDRRRVTYVQRGAARTLLRRRSRGPRSRAGCARHAAAPAELPASAIRPRMRAAGVELSGMRQPRGRCRHLQDHL
ncbi:MAG: hypothetical protein MZV64_67825 [Ignavibacteriales bacterium]|nr:hypothetical protein [Ignavibacteriales bacterium]